ncbi:MAG: DUF3846 domain-containing protein [Clostridia bacterium]|nr:DUF3846 domain-containing protein [Clostridia bacterium]
MKIIVCKPGRLPEQRVVREEMTLRMMQQIVEGHIEVVHADGMPKDVVIVCNEEGKLQNLPQNMWITRGGAEDLLVGTFFVCKTEGEELVPLTDAEAAKIAAKLSGGVIPTTDPKLTDRRCCLCGKELGTFGNNAWPLSDGECCDDCNGKLVIPQRIREMGTTKRRTVMDEITRIAGRICDEICKYNQ